MSKARALLYLLILVSLVLPIRASLGDAPPLPLVFSLLGLLLTLLLLGALLPRLQMYGDVLCSVPEARGKVALTFDDGPDPKFTSQVLDQLRARRAKATFFVLGAKAAEHPALIRRMLEEGHSVGMHSFSHQRGYAFLTPRAVAQDIETCRSVIRQAIVREHRSGGGSSDGGSSDVRSGSRDDSSRRDQTDLDLLWFRPPVGQTSPRTFAGLRRAGAEMVGWSIKVRDGLRRTTAGEVLARLRRDLREGDIVLLHDAWERKRAGDHQAPAGARALEEILDLCAERALVPVSLDELVRAGSAG